MSSTFSGVQQLWQIANAATSDFQDVNVGTGVTAGFRSTGVVGSAIAATNTVTAAAGVTSAAIALNGVAGGSDIAVAGGSSLTTVSVSGSIVNVGTGATATNELTLSTTAAEVDVLNLSLTSNTEVTLTGFEAISTFNAAGTTGNLTIDMGAAVDLTAATFGAGKDIVTIDTATLESGALAINLGAGNDVLNLAANAAADSTAVTITLGAGNDTLALTALANLTGTTAAAITADMVTVADFNGAQDVLDLSGLLGGGAAPAGLVRDVLVNTELADISAATSFRAALVAAAAVTTAGEYSIFNYGGDAYIFNNAGTAALEAGDGLVKIVGFQVENITATNFVGA